MRVAGGEESKGRTSLLPPKKTNREGENYFATREEGDFRKTCENVSRAWRRVWKIQIRVTTTFVAIVSRFMQKLGGKREAGKKRQHGREKGWLEEDLSLRAKTKKPIVSVFIRMKIRIPNHPDDKEVSPHFCNMQEELSSRENIPTNYLRATRPRKKKPRSVLLVLEAI